MRKIIEDARLMLAVALFLGALDGCEPQVLQSNSSGGLFRTSGVINKQAKSISIADAEFAKYGKISKVTHVDILSNTISYDCIDK